MLDKFANTSSSPTIAIFLSAVLECTADETVRDSFLRAINRVVRSRKDFVDPELAKVITINTTMVDHDTKDTMRDTLSSLLTVRPDLTDVVTSTLVKDMQRPIVPYTQRSTALATLDYLLERRSKIATEQLVTDIALVTICDEDSSVQGMARAVLENTLRKSPDLMSKHCLDIVSRPVSDDSEAEDVRNSALSTLALIVEYCPKMIGRKIRNNLLSVFGSTEPSHTLLLTRTALDVVVANRPDLLSRSMGSYVVPEARTKKTARTPKAAANALNL